MKLIRRAVVVTAGLVAALAAVLMPAGTAGADTPAGRSNPTVQPDNWVSG